MSKYDDTHNSKTYESLSAFLDNEASQADIEVLLTADKEGLANKLDHYHQIHQSTQLDGEQFIFDSGAFLSGIKDKLKEEMSDSNVVAFPQKNVLQQTNVDAEFSELEEQNDDPQVSHRPMWGGLAVAASVAVAVVMGGNLLLGGSSTDVTTPVFATNSVPVVEQNSISIQNIDGVADLENNERLKNYLRQHAQQASMTVGQGMIPMARVVSYPQDVKQ